MLYGTVYLAAVFLLLERLTLVEGFLSLTEGDIDLRASLVIDEDEGGYDGVARLLCG